LACAKGNLTCAKPEALAEVLFELILAKVRAEGEGRSLVALILGKCKEFRWLKEIKIMNPKSFYKISYGLYLISSNFEEKQNGCISNTVIQVSSKPAKLSFALSKDNLTTEIIKESGHFAATVLSQAVGMDVIGEFVFKTGKDTDKFAKFKTKVDSFGTKYIAENMNAIFSCKVLDSVDVGSHILFIGEVEEADTLSDEPVMTYEYYHQVKNGTTPKNSPVYQAETIKSGYRCSVCGHIEELDELPEDFICPICSNPVEYFEKI
jgi:flavin reductase (DIM6/NTAB) family NADH-FMN oxidoreductase RutF/rubredoxin